MSYPGPYTLTMGERASPNCSY